MLARAGVSFASTGNITILTDFETNNKWQIARAGLSISHIIYTIKAAANKLATALMMMPRYSTQGCWYRVHESYIKPKPQPIPRLPEMNLGLLT
jgi:hypothetical protein